MTAKTLPEALALEAARGDEYRAEIRAEGFRAGAEAMRDAAARKVENAGNYLENRYVLAGAIRSLPTPEDDNG